MKAKPLTLLVVIPAILLAGNVISQTDSSYNQRTPWGDPDISGMWSYASLTPLQRPERLGEKEFYTPEEAAQIFANTQQDVADRPGDVGSYNYQWFDRGEVSADFRTSLIFEPSNGRLPVNEATIASQRERAEYLREHSADSWLDRTNWDRCITYHGVPAVSSGYNNSCLLYTSDAADE